MPLKTEQTQQNSEVADKPFEKQSLSEMEDTLRKEADTTEEQSTEDSEQNDSQESSSEDQTDASTSDAEAKDNTESDKKDNQVDEDKANLQKQYKELQAEFTRKSQELAKMRKELESKTSSKAEKPADSDEVDRELEELRAKYPDAAKLFQKIADKTLKNVVGEKVKPLQDQVVLRAQEENINAFNKAVDEFKTSDLAELETDVLAVYNENPEQWGNAIRDNPRAFDLLKKEAVYRNIDKVSEIKSRKKASSVENKSREVKNAHVGGKSKSTKSPEMPDLKSFKKLSLKEMEALLPVNSD